MKKILLPAVACAVLCLTARPQLHYHRNTTAAALSASTGFSGTGANIDVLYHRAAWTVNPNSSTKNISGTVVTRFRTQQSNVSSLSFDLNKAAFNNASLVVRYRGITCTRSFPASGSVNILNITLPAVIAAAGTIDSVTITYSGTPPARNGAA